MVLVFGAVADSLVQMMHRIRLFLVLVACTVPAFSQNTDADAADVRRFPTQWKAPQDDSTLRKIYRKLALGASMVSKEAWPEANLKYEFPTGWNRAGDVEIKGIVRTYVAMEKELSLMVNFTKLTRGEAMTREELLQLPLANLTGVKVDLKPVIAQGRAAELEMIVFQASTTSAESGTFFMTVGRMLGNGALYGIGSVARTQEVSEQEFERFLKTLDWIEKDKDIGLPAIDSLSVNGAGFSIPCDGALMATISAELPYGSAALRLDQRLEIAAFDMRGCEIPFKEMTVAFLERLAISTGGNYRLEETKVGGVAGLTARLNQNRALFGGAITWRMDFALRDGFFCVAMGTWMQNFQEYGKRHERLLAKIAFTKPEGNPDMLIDEPRKSLTSLFYNEVGLKGFREGRFGVATNAFERAVELNPKDSNIAQNLINSLIKQGRPESALAAVEKSRIVLPDHQELKQWQAALLIRAGRDEEGQALYEILFQGGFRQQDDLALWIESLQKNGKSGRAAEIAAIAFDETGQLSWRRILANCLWTAGKLDEAKFHYQEMAAELASEPGFASDHASLLLEAGDFTEVMDLVRKWEKDHEAPYGMLFTKGMAEAGLDWYKDAVATFTKLDGLVPGNQTVKEALANAQSMMGRGSQEGIRDDLSEVAVPHILLDHAAEALSQEDFEKDRAGEGSIYLTSIRVWDWSEGSDARMTQHQRVKILDASGMKAFSTLYVTFNPNSERVNINRMVVTDGNGKEVATYRREEMYVRDGNGALADGKKVICIPVPALAEGATIDFTYTKSLLGTDKRFPMTTGGIPESVGLVYGAEVFTGEIDKIRFASTDRLKKIDNVPFHGYEARNLKRQIGDSYLPNYDHWGLMCWASDNRNTWESETSDYLTEIRDCLADDTFAAKVVEDLQLADKSPSEVTHSVVRWLNAKFQYQGLEFGRRARIPAKAEITLSRGFGDCKDLSVMVRAILRRAGVKANLALVNSAGIIREDLPGFDQFDHMVLHLPELGGMVLDATLQHFNTPDALAPTAVGGRAFVIEGEHPGFVTMNEAADTERIITVDRTVSILPDSGDARVKESVTVSPAEAAMFRYALSATAGAEHANTMETMLRRKESRIELKGFNVSDLDDPFMPLRMEFDYMIHNAFHTDAETISGSLPHVIESWMFGLEQERDRSIGIEIRTGVRGVVTDRIQVPDGYKWIPPSDLQPGVTELGSFKGKVEWTAENGVIQMAATWETIPSSGDVGLYRRVRAASDSMFHLLGDRVRFSKE